MILDTDILVDIRRKLPAALAWFASLPSVPVISGLAAMELVEGSRNAQEMRSVRQFLSVFSLAWPTDQEMQHAYLSILPLRLAHGFDLIDALVAATAIGRGEELATFNRKHYRAIPELVIVEPYRR